MYALQDVANLVTLGTNGYAYALRTKQEFGSITSVNLSAGTVTNYDSAPIAEAARVGPSGHKLYLGLEYGDFYEYDVEDEPAIGDGTVWQPVAGSECGGIWFSQDGTRMFTGCGTVLSVSDVASQDLQLLSTDPVSLAGFAWANDSQATGLLAVIPGGPFHNDAYFVPVNTAVQIYASSSNGFNLNSQTTLPAFSAGGQSFAGHGMVVSWNSPGSTLFVLEQADSTAKLANTYAITTITNAASVTPCAYDIEASAISLSGGESNLMRLPAYSTNCDWIYTTDVTWMTGFSGTTAAAGQEISFDVQANPTQTARIGHISVGGQTITATQDPANCTFQLGLITLGVYADAATQLIPFTTGTNCGWTVNVDVPWVAITSANSGTGSGTVSISIAQNTTGSNRSGFLTIAGQSIGVLQNETATPVPGTVTPLDFEPTSPCRLLDTRNADGPFGGPLISGGTSRDFFPSQSVCGVPASALAYALNVTVVPSGPLGYLTVSPTGGTRPNVSTLNSWDGRIKANAAIVPAGSSGGINVFASNDTQVVIDIIGYFDAGNGAYPAVFVPTQPCRMVDTRNANGPLAGPYLAGGTPRDLPLDGSSCEPLYGPKPLAYSLNVTAVPHEPLGFLTLWPSNESQPFVSTLNAPTGTVVANAALMGAFLTGDVSVFATQDTDLVIDTNGFFAYSYTTVGLHFYPIAPCRGLDTRSGNGPLNGVATYDIGTACGVPAYNAQAIVVNATVVPSGPLGYLTLWRAGGPQPFVSTLNAIDGAVTSNMAIVPVNANQIGAFASNPTDLVIDVFGYFAY
ncbi:MAG: BACON domain-containing carbohydrate-binding protein [Bryobacteraceae bacterium]